MARLACVSVHNLTLQLLYKKHPRWRELPAAVVSKDSPYGTILTVNSRAGEFGIEPGQRYAGALSLNHELRGDTVPEQTVFRWVERLAETLRGYSPQVEIEPSEPGVFWLEVTGLSSLYPDLQAWCTALRRSLSETGFSAALAAGTTRFGCYAAAKSVPDQLIFPHPQSERAFALGAGITVLDLPAEAAERLEMLGVRTVGSFVDLPAGAVGKRFGPEVMRLHRFAAGDQDLAVRSAENLIEPQWVIKLPYAELSGERLVETIAGSLRNVTGELGKSHRLIRQLNIRLVLERDEAETIPVEPILPAAPSLDVGLLEDLIALRLENLRLPAAVASIRISAETTAERTLQSELFTVASKESRKEVDRVFARLRGLWGNSCIQRARLEDEHVPERSYSWEDLRSLPRESGAEGFPGGRECVEGRPVLLRAVRRIFAEPSPVEQVPSGHSLPAARGFVGCWGPYPLWGRWWLGERPRKYGYVETGSGEILWLCRDGSDGRWRQIGAVE